MPPESSTEVESPAAASAPEGGGEAASSTQDAPAADGPESSTGQQHEGAKPPASPLAAVKAALAEARADAAPAKLEAQSESAGAIEASPDSARGAQDQAQDGKNHEDRFDKHPRFQELNRRVKSAEPKAQRFDALTTYLADNRISSDELANGLQVLALAKTDPSRALELLTPLVAQLEQAVGKRLPSDLQDKVDKGVIDEETAAELAQKRSREKALESTVQMTAAERAEAARLEQERQQEAEFSAHANAVAVAVSKWEQEWRASDPDYLKKAPLLRDRIKLDIAENGFPESVEDALKRAKDIKAGFEKELQGMFPKERRPSTVVTGGAGGPTTPAPKNPREVVRAALRSS